MKINFDKVNISAPWFLHSRYFIELLINSKDWRLKSNELARLRNISNYQGEKIEFIPQFFKSTLVSYEKKIYFSGKIFTRNVLHDFFNSIIWLQFPKIKSCLNFLHVDQIKKKYF